MAKVRVKNRGQGQMVTLLLHTVYKVSGVNSSKANLKVEVVYKHSSVIKIYMPRIIQSKGRKIYIQHIDLATVIYILSSNFC